MTIEKIPAARLNPAAYNPRKDLKPGDRELSLIHISEPTRH